MQSLAAGFSSVVSLLKANRVKLARRATIFQHWIRTTTPGSSPVQFLLEEQPVDRVVLGVASINFIEKGKVKTYSELYERSPLEVSCLCFVYCLLVLSELRRTSGNLILSGRREEMVSYTKGGKLNTFNASYL